MVYLKKNPFCHKFCGRMKRIFFKSTDFVCWGKMEKQSGAGEHKLAAKSHQTQQDPVSDQPNKII